MDSPLASALLITAIGATLLFLSLLLFYGLILLLMAASPGRIQTRDDKASLDQLELPIGSCTAHEQEALAAAVAVAVARARSQAIAADGQADSSEKDAANGAPSTWWMLHHQQKLVRDQGQRRGR